MDVYKLGMTDRRGGDSVGGVTSPTNILIAGLVVAALAFGASRQANASLRKRPSSWAD